MTLRSIGESPISVSAPTALIALGANLPFRGDPPARTLRAALAEMGRRGVAIEAVSRFFATPCHPPGAGPDYVNAAAAIDPRGRAPAELLALLHEIEAAFGRRRDLRWGRRTLDLDLLAVGDSVLPDTATWRRWRDLLPEAQAREAPDRLILPHPRLHERAFVLVPLADIAPDWRHPVTRQDVAQMLAALPAAERAAIRPLDGG